MIQIVINYDELSKEFKIYEPNSDTLLVSNNLTEALVNLSLFLNSSNLIKGDILGDEQISYHLDSHTMKIIIESNVNLLKQLKSGISGFMKSSQKFGGSRSLPSADFKDNLNNFKNKKSNDFSKTGFSKAGKKFGK